MIICARNTLFVLGLLLGCVYAQEKALRLAVLSTYPPTNCGIAEFAKNMCAAILSHKRNIEIEIFSTDRKPHIGLPVKMKGTKVHTYEFVRETEVETLREIADRINEGNFDALLVQHELGLLHFYPNYETFLNRIRKETTTFVFVHTGNPYVSYNIREVIQRLAVSADYMVGLGWKVKYALVHCYGIPEHKVLYIPHGVQLAKLKKGKNKKSLKIVKNKDRTTFLMAGLMRAMKGIYNVLDAMKILKDRGTLGNGFLQIAGKDQEDGALKKHFMNKVREYGLSDKIKWDFGFHSLNKLTRYHLQADIFLAPFTVEVPTSGTISFALSAGMPVIATPFGLSGELLGLPVETPEYSAKSIKDDARGGYVSYTKYGAVVPYKDTVSLANAMEKFIKNKEMCKKMGEAAKKRMAKITWKKVSAVLIDFISKKKEPANMIPNMYKKHLLSSNAGWVGSYAVDLNDSPIGRVPDGAYNLYTDGYLVINALIKENKIVELGARTMVYKKGGRDCLGEETFLYASSHIHPPIRKNSLSEKVTENVQIFSGSDEKKPVLKLGHNKVLIISPNILATVSMSKEGNVILKILKVSRFTMSKGLLGISILKRFSGFHQETKKKTEEWLIKNWSENVFSTSADSEEQDDLKGSFYGLPYTMNRNLKRDISHYKEVYAAEYAYILRNTKEGAQIRKEVARQWPHRTIKIKMKSIPTKRSLRKDPLDKYVIKHLVSEGKNKIVKEVQFT
ncbi:hypothetical protein NEMIN01_1537 [Nematocida minor]|uniref:uncharacterized protein n=1 Tax=Nematocida minor TaxID=1912983 RepID=UPI00222078AA|nr:uncharacterized protein NEMIN01_1537 [Nematocida minor]KAI5191511.1 hypothetical protein NEMIN01_1537 [Nematocida minor]